MKKEMEEFLISSYFGVIKGTELIKVCANKAYMDLARKVPYRYSWSELEESKNKNSDYIMLKLSFKESIINCIDENVRAKSEPIAFIDAVYKKANEQSGLYKDDAKFYYGLAQKWVNMTLKYLWLWDKCPLDEKELHAPLDRYIIHAMMRGNVKNKYGLALRVEGLTEDLPWSSLDNKKLYLAIQDELKGKIDGMSRIGWEHLAWIEQSRIES